jgi:hypothetical protein
MSVPVLIEAVEAEGFGGAVVASAFGDVQVAGVFEGRSDGGPDGGQVGGPAAGAAGRGIFAEGHFTAATPSQPSTTPSPEIPGCHPPSMIN